MIERAVFSYFNADESFTNKAGFNTFSDFLYTMALATELASHHFKEVEIATTSWGAMVLKTAGIQATEYSTVLDSMKGISRWFWAYGKLIAYTEQTRPFVHIDNDVFLFSPLPERILNARLCFQSKEQMNIPIYNWYNLLRPCWDKASVKPRVIHANVITDYAYNCGICGGYDFGFFKEWIRCSAEYLFAPENQKVFFEEYRHIQMHQNLWHEQYFGASLVKAHGLRDKVELITDNITDPAWAVLNRVNKTYTHLWGVTKTNDTTMRIIRTALRQRHPELYNKVTGFINNYLFSECQVEEKIKVL
jgi:hypothetical protein